MSEFDILREAAGQDGLYPMFAGMVQAVVSAQEMSDHAKVHRLRELSAALNKVIDAQHTSHERSGEYVRAAGDGGHEGRRTAIVFVDEGAIDRERGGEK